MINAIHAISVRRITSLLLYIRNFSRSYSQDERNASYYRLQKQFGMVGFISLMVMEIYPFENNG